MDEKQLQYYQELESAVLSLLIEHKMGHSTVDAMQKVMDVIAKKTKCK